MPEYDFDKPINRYNTNSLKYDFMREYGYPEDVLPLWIADMDLQVAAPIQEALHKAVNHGIFSYSDAKETYYQAVADWFKNYFDWQTQPEWLVKTPGVVFALAMAIRSFTQRGDSIIIQPPVYYPFYSVIRNNNRQIVENELCYHDGRYEIDFKDFERKIEENHVKLFLFCSPHNPVGRVWKYEELHTLGEICRRHDVLVVSDEIHCDFTLPAHPHIVFTQACPELADQSVICTSPSKTFNLAGL